MPRHGGVTYEERAVVSEDLADVLAGFINRRKGSITIHDVLARIIGGQRQRQVSAEAVQEVA